MNEAVVLELRTIALTLVQMHAAAEIREAKRAALEQAEQDKERVLKVAAIELLEMLAPLLPKKSHAQLAQAVNTLRAVFAAETPIKSPAEPTHEA